MGKKRKRDEKQKLDKTNYITPKKSKNSDVYDETDSLGVTTSGAKRKATGSDNSSLKQNKKQKKDSGTLQKYFENQISIEAQKLEYFKAQKENRIKSLHKAISKVSKVKSQVTVNARIEQLETNGYEVTNVRTDGNCLFRAVAHSLYGNDTNYRQIRKEAVAYMRANAALFRPFMEDDQNLEDYIEHMSLDRVWGGNQEIVAIANAFNLQIVVFGIGFIQVINPDNYDGDREMQTIGLLHHTNHFWAVEDTQDEFRIPTIEDLPPLTAANETVTRSETSSADSMDLTDDEDLPDLNLSDNDLVTISKLVARALEGSGYKLENVPGDGNCLFRAFAKALAAANQLRETDAPNHAELRQLATIRLQHDEAGLYTKNFKDNQTQAEALKELSTPGEYAGTLAFQLLADIFGVNIFVVGGTSNFIRSATAPDTAINLIIFYNGVNHFQAVIPEDYHGLFIFPEEEISDSSIHADQASGSHTDQASVTQASKDNDDPISDIRRLFEEYKDEVTLQDQADNYDKILDVGIEVSTILLIIGIALSYTS